MVSFVRLVGSLQNIIKQFFNLCSLTFHLLSHLLHFVGQIAELRV
jgi:hypothetical protein